MSKSEKFGIIVSGGPAPGINTVIASVTFTAQRSGYDVIGFVGGARAMVNNASEVALNLGPSVVTPIQNLGGSLLRTSRFNPFENDQDKEKFFSVLEENQIKKLVMIGGEGSAYLSHQIAQHTKDIDVVHVPKTIDNDLILPNDYPSFGFETARYIGTNLLTTLISEAKTTNRWFVVRTMGRNAGFLALGLGLAAGASVTVIPEQFESGIVVKDVVDLILPSILKRHQNGKSYGTIVIAEGIIDKMDLEKIPELKNAHRDAIGRIEFSKVDLEDLIVDELEKRIATEDLAIKFKPENIGYVLRCAAPVSFDIEYTKFLGYGAVKFLLEGKSDIMVVRNYDKLDYVELTGMADEEGRIKSRHVDMDSDLYKVTSNFMIK